MIIIPVSAIGGMKEKSHASAEFNKNITVMVVNIEAAK